MNEQFYKPFLTKLSDSLLLSLLSVLSLACLSVDKKERRVTRIQKK